MVVQTFHVIEVSEANANEGGSLKTTPTAQSNGKEKFYQTTLSILMVSLNPDAIDIIDNEKFPALLKVFDSDVIELDRKVLECIFPENILEDA